MPELWFDEAPQPPQRQETESPGPAIFQGPALLMQAFYVFEPILCRLSQNLLLGVLFIEHPQQGPQIGAGFLCFLRFR
jgi:hypothetical protein